MAGAVQGSGAAQGPSPIKKTVSKEVTENIKSAFGKKADHVPATETKIVEVAVEHMSGTLEGVPSKVEASLTASAMENVKGKKEKELGKDHLFTVGGSDKKTSKLFKQNIPEEKR